MWIMPLEIAIEIFLLQIRNLIKALKKIRSNKKIGFIIL